MPTPKPAVAHPNLKPNKVGLTLRDYEGAPSTLCAGCGHDSISAALICGPKLLLQIKLATPAGQ